MNILNKFYRKNIENIILIMKNIQVIELKFWDSFQ